MKKIYFAFVSLLFIFSAQSQILEGFENEVFPPVGWLVTDNLEVSSSGWQTVSATPYAPLNGTNSAFVNRENVGIGNTSEEWLVTPAVNLIDNDVLSFSSRQTLVGDQGTIYEIRISTTSQSDKDSFTTIAMWTETTLTTTVDQLVPETKEVAISGFAGTSYIAFVKKHTQQSMTTGGDRWIIDDVKLGQVTTVLGDVKYGFGTDCESNSIPVRHARININDSDGTHTVFTNYLGKYMYGSAHLSGTVAAGVVNSGLFNFSAASQSFEFQTFGNTATVDFCLMPNILQPDLQAYIMPFPVRSGNQNYQRVILRNVGTQAVSGTVSFTFPQNHFQIVANPNYTVSGNTVSWNYTNLMPFSTVNEHLWFSVNAPNHAEYPVIAGDQFLLTAVINPVVGDAFPLDNSSAVVVTAVNSYDPNDIMVSEGPFITSEQTDDFLHYTIRFQNIGSAEAQKVLVRNVLEDNLNPDTFEIIGGSHAFETTLRDKTIEFTFNNINLPGVSENEEASQGYVMYRIKPSAAVGLGSVIKNQAEIYFDFNYPIQTNTATTTVTTLGTKNFNRGNIFRIYPNPASNELNIKVQNTEILSVTIANSLGQKVFESVKNVEKIDVSKFNSGIYFITLDTANGTEKQQFIKH